VCSTGSRFRRTSSKERYPSPSPSWISQSRISVNTPPAVDSRVGVDADETEALPGLGRPDGDGLDVGDFHATRSRGGRPSRGLDRPPTTADPDRGVSVHSTGTSRRDPGVMLSISQRQIRTPRLGSRTTPSSIRSERTLDRPPDTGRPLCRTYVAGAVHGRSYRIRPIVFRLAGGSTRVVPTWFPIDNGSFALSRPGHRSGREPGRNGQSRRDPGAMESGNSRGTSRSRTGGAGGGGI